MIFVETSVFTRQVLELLTDDEYRHLQDTLISHPDVGKVIPGSGGLRKIRVAYQGKGKSGGLRTIYYWAGAEDRIYMVYMYAKSKRGDLTPTQLRTLRQLIEED